MVRLFPPTMPLHVHSPVFVPVAACISFTDGRANTLTNRMFEKNRSAVAEVSDTLVSCGGCLRGSVCLQVHLTSWLAHGALTYCRPEPLEFSDYRTPSTTLSAIFFFTVLVCGMVFSVLHSY